MKPDNRKALAGIKASAIGENEAGKLVTETRMSRKQEESVRVRRLLFRASHRGFREMDIVLGRFCDEQTRVMGSAGQEILARLLKIDDRPMFEALCAPESSRQALLDALAPDDPEVQSMLKTLAEWIRQNPPGWSEAR